MAKLSRVAERTLFRRDHLRNFWRTPSWKYQNRAIETAQVIEELISLAKMSRSCKRGDQLGLTEDEVAFYDALETTTAQWLCWGIKLLS
jgi:hypothetical protein